VYCNCTVFVPVCGRPYGFESRQPYPANNSVSDMVTSYAKRRVVYLVGEKDMCNDLLPTCNVECWQKENGCDRNSMDTRCPAMLQGPFRKLRGQVQCLRQSPICNTPLFHYVAVVFVLGAYRIRLIFVSSKIFMANQRTTLQ
jgi:hypothetical protein